MRKLCTAVILFAAGVCAVALLFSPLCALGAPQAYADNVAVRTYNGLCYPFDGNYRVDITGSERDMLCALSVIDATPVKSVSIGDMRVVYAYCPRVCSRLQTLPSGEKYNVMAAYSNGNISIGTPILSGCY